MKKLYAIMAVLMLSISANALEAKGRVYATSADSETTVDQAVLTVNHQIDPSFSAEVAADLVKKDVVKRANLSWKGLVPDAVLTVGIQSPVYSAHVNALGYEWLGNKVAGADSAYSLTGSFKNVHYAVESRDGVKGDHRNIYAGIVWVQVLPELELLAGYENDALTQVSVSKLAATLTYGKGKLLVETNKSHQKDNLVADTNSLSAVGSYEVNEKLGLYASHTTGDVEFKAASGFDSKSSVGLTHPLAKGLNVAGLYSEVKVGSSADSTLSLKLAADF